MGTLSMLAQLAAIFAALYLGFTRSWGLAAAVFVTVGVGHLVSSAVINLLLSLQEKKLNRSQKMDIAVSGEVPTFWLLTAKVVCAIYIALVAFATVAAFNVR